MIRKTKSKEVIAFHEGASVSNSRKGNLEKHYL